MVNGYVSVALGYVLAQGGVNAQGVAGLIAVPSLHRTRLLHIITLARQLRAQVDPAP